MATKPAAPSKVELSKKTESSILATFTDAKNNGGSPITDRQIGYGTDAKQLQKFISSDRSTTITGLKPSTKYYFRARTKNAIGWSDWGSTGTATTLAAKSPEAPSKITLSNSMPTSVVANFVDGGNNGLPIIDREIGYGTTEYQAQKIVKSDGTTLIKDLTPGMKYYFKARTKNSKGWSDWGPVTSITTLSAVRIKDGGVWKLALPYVKVAGVWKLSRPWLKQGDTWKPTN